MKDLLLSNGETIAYIDTEKGEKVLVLIHGNMTSSVHFDTLIEALKDDYRIIAPDLRGFGKSTYKNPVSYLKDFSEDITELMKKLSLEGSYILGWSTGGGIAMQLAADEPLLVDKLILLESVGISGYPIFRKDLDGQPIIGDFITTKEAIAKDPVQVKPILEAYEQNNKEFMRAVWNSVIYTHNKPSEDRYNMYLEDMMTQRNLVDLDHALVWFNISDEHNGVVEGTGEIHKIKVPVLIVQGDRDYVVPPQMGESIKEALGTYGKYIHGDWGHSPIVDGLGQLVNEIKGFLEE